MENKFIEKWMDEIPEYPKGKQIHPDNEYFLKSRGVDGRHILVAELNESLDLTDLPKLAGISLDLKPNNNGCILTLTLEDSEHLDKFALIMTDQSAKICTRSLLIIGIIVG